MYVGLRIDSFCFILFYHDIQFYSKMFIHYVNPSTLNPPAYDRTYDKTCATSEDSDQPAHQRSLIRVFAVCMCLLQSPGYRKRDTREPLPYWVDVQADLSHC